jgi:hypothetical protein
LVKWELKNTYLTEFSCRLSEMVRSWRILAVRNPLALSCWYIGFFFCQCITIFPTLGPPHML